MSTCWTSSARWTGTTQGSVTRWIRIFTVALPIIWALAYMTLQSPVLMIQIGGVATGIFLLAAEVPVWYQRRSETDPDLYGGTAFNALLVISSIAIVLLGLYTGANVSESSGPETDGARRTAPRSGSEVQDAADAEGRGLEVRCPGGTRPSRSAAR